MTRVRITLLLLLVALGAACTASGCATLGGDAAEPEGLPHNGTGPFRDLDSDETMVTPGGAALSIANVSMDSAMVASDGSLFYAAARTLPAGPMPDAGAVDDAGAGSDSGVGSDAGLAPDAGGGPLTFAAPDWARHQPRTISRSPARAGNPGFDAGSEILAASSAWEGGYVSDPWAVLRDDGSVRLYYAAAGGIGVASASSPSGPYTAQPSPVIAASGSSVPRRPSVIDTRLLAGASHPFLMYYELDGAILVAGSSDGLSFSPIGPLTLTPMPARDDRDGDEVEVGGPGALVVTSPAQRSFVRLYFESRRSNGNTLVTLAASADGTTFEAFGRPVVEERDRRFPSAIEIDDRVSLLYQWAPRDRAASRSMIAVGIAPGSVRLAPEEM